MAKTFAYWVERPLELSMPPYYRWSAARPESVIAKEGRRGTHEKAAMPSLVSCGQRRRWLPPRKAHQQHFKPPPKYHKPSPRQTSAIQFITTFSSLLATSALANAVINHMPPIVYNTISDPADPTRLTGYSYVRAH